MKKFWLLVIIALWFAGLFVTCFWFAYQVGKLASYIDNHGGVKTAVERVWNGASK